MIRVLVLLFLFVHTTLGLTDYFKPSALVGTSAESIRMGNISSFSNNSDSIFSNPAALYKMPRYSGTLFVTRFMDEVSYRSVSGALRTIYGNFGFGYYTAGVQDIPKTQIGLDGLLDESLKTFQNLIDNKNVIVERIGSFGYKNTQMQASYQFSRSRRFHMGVALNYYLEQISSVTGKGMSLDFGLIYLTRKFAVAASFYNILPNSQLTYSNGEKQALPLESSYAVKYKWDDFTILGQIKFATSDNKLLKSFGVNYKPNWLPYIRGSFGYKETPIKRLIDNKFEDTKIGNIVLGIGLEFRGVSFDYAHEKSEHKVFNHKHYFSVSFKQ